MTFMAVTYDREGFAGVGFHPSVQEALDSASAAGCIFASVGEHPKSVRTRHFARDGNGWRELEGGEELDRLRKSEAEPKMFWQVA